MRIGVVGLGKMGRALTERLLSQQVNVVTWNRSSPPLEEMEVYGAAPASDLGSVWDHSDAVVTVLADDSAVTDVCLGIGGLLDHPPLGGLLIDMSTISPSTSAVLAEAAHRKGVAYLRSPVSGNPGVLMSGNLVIICSGERATYDRAAPILALIGSRSHYVGSQEQSRVVKLAINALLAATAEMLSEIVLLCEASGLDRATLLEVVTSSVVGSPFLRYKAQPLVDRRYEPSFTTEMLLKDLRLTAEVAQSCGIRMPVTDLLVQLTNDCCDEGYGQLDFLALLPHLQRLAGLRPDV